MTETGDQLTDAADARATASSDGGPRSRRSLITAAAAALGAIAAQAVVLPSPASAASVSLGHSNHATDTTDIQNLSSQPGAKALMGRAISSSSSSSIGVLGDSRGPNGTGVYGKATNGTNARGVLGRSTDGYGVRGESTGNTGVYAAGGIAGVFGLATGTGLAFGVYGDTDSGGGYAGYFDGNVGVQGTLSKAAGSFKIDHPLDPERRWLSHSFVESPDMKNIYDGVATAGANGTVTVTLPRYFDALNRSFRYQLTAIGGPAPSLHVAREISKRSFRIGGAEPGQRISWQVTGIRQDDYANAHRIKVDTRKTNQERGTRLFVPKGSGARRMDLGPAEPKRHKPAKSKP